MRAGVTLAAGIALGAGTIQKLRAPERQRSAKSNVFIVEGLPQ
jgi:hypothetical protein